MKQVKKSEYDNQAESFLEATKTEFSKRLLGTFKYFPDDKESRDVYEITLKNSNHCYIFRFGDSIANTNYRTGKDNQGYSDSKVRLKWQPLSAYSVLAALQKYDVGTLDDFINEFGYSFSTTKEYRQIETTYHNVFDEYENVKKLWPDESDLEALHEIS